MGLVQPTRLDGQAHDIRRLAGVEGFPQSAGLDRQIGRRLDHALGGRLAALPGARVQDAFDLRQAGRRQPPGLAGHAGRDGAVLCQGGSQDGRYRHQWLAAAARQQQLQGAEGRRRQARLQGMPYRQHGHQFGRPRRSYVLPADRLLLPGLQMGRQMVDALHRDPQGRGDRPSRGPAERHGDQDQPRRLRQGDRRRLCRQGRQAAGAEGPHRRRRRQFDRKPTPAAELRVGQISARHGQFVGAGGQELHAPHHRLGLRHIRQAGAHVSRHHHGRHYPRRSAPRSVTRLRRRL